MDDFIRADELIRIDNNVDDVLESVTMIPINIDYDVTTMGEQLKTWSKEKNEDEFIIFSYMDIRNGRK